MVKVKLDIKNTPIKVEGETDPEKTENVAKYAISNIREMATKKYDMAKDSIKTLSGDVKEMFMKGTDDLKETSDMRHKHKVEKQKIKMEKDQQEHVQKLEKDQQAHVQKMEEKELDNNKKGLFDKWSEHRLQQKELEIKQKEMEEEAKRQELREKEEIERKKRILTIIEVIVGIVVILLISILYQKLFK